MKVGTKIRAGGFKFNHNEALVRDAARVRSLKVMTGLRAGGIGRNPSTSDTGLARPKPNHNETIVRDRTMRRALKVKTGVKAGGLRFNHNETLLR